MSNIRFVPHPGEYLKDAINELGMSQNEFAIRIGTTGKTISKIISGEQNITFDIASKIAEFFGTSTNVWLNLQNSYNEYIRQVEIEKAIEEEYEILSYFDKKYIEKLLNIEFKKQNKKEILSKVKQFFMVNSLKNLKASDLFSFYRTSVLKDVDDKQIVLRNAWISLAMYKSKDIECSSYNEKKLISYLPKIKKLIKEDPEVFVPLLKEYLNDSGIKFIILPYLKGSNVSAVTRWIQNEGSILIAINDHGKDADRFWFNIFHEIGHAIRNNKRHISISYEKDKINDDDEKFANDFARKQLINQNDYEKFIKENDFSLKKMKIFAASQDIPLFILIGRLQNDELLNWNEFNSYKIKYEIK